MIHGTSVLTGPHGNKPISSIGRSDSILVLKGKLLVRSSVVDRVKMQPSTYLFRLLTENGSELVCDRHTEVIACGAAMRKRKSVAKIMTTDAVLCYSEGIPVVSRVIMIEDFSDTAEPCYALDTPFYDPYIAGGIFCRG